MSEALGAEPPPQFGWRTWCRQQFGPSWRMHIGNTLASASLLMVSLLTRSPLVFPLLFALMLGASATLLGGLWFTRREARREGVDLEALDVLMETRR